MTERQAGMAPDPNEIEMMRKIAQRDKEAFTTCYDRHAPTVFAFLIHLLKDRTEAEDILQETFWQVFRQAGVYDEKRGSPLAWIITVARSRGIDRLRQMTLHQRRDAGPPDLLPDIEGPDIGTKRETCEVIGKALHDLPPEQREPILLAFFDGFTHNEIAEQLRIPLGTIKTRIRLGMKRLYERLQKIEGEL